MGGARPPAGSGAVMCEASEALACPTISARMMAPALPGVLFGLEDVHAPRLGEDETVAVPWSKGREALVGASLRGEGGHGHEGRRTAG